jgi:hypothetical protein
VVPGRSVTNAWQSQAGNSSPLAWRADQLVGGVGQAEPLGEGGGQQQPGVSDRGEMTRRHDPGYPAEVDATSPASAPAVPEAGSACRCTTFHSPSSRRNTVVARSTYGCGGAPLIDAVVCSIATM